MALDDVTAALDAVAVAVRVVEAAMPSVVIERIDPGGGPTPLHDLELSVEGQAPIAMEVTTSTHEELLHTRARFAEQLAVPIEAPQLRWSWHLYAEVGADVRRIIREVSAALGDLESEWQASPPSDLSFFGPTSTARSPAAARLWQELKVIWGRAYPLDRPASVFISPPSDPREWTDSHPGAFVTKAVEMEAAKDDNQRKLARSGRKERHLFVYIDTTSFPAWQDMDRGCLPPSAPQVSKTLTTVWVATVGSDGRDILWRVTPPSDWEVVFG